MPLNVSVAALKVIPLGRVPVFVTAGAGYPVVVIEKEKAWPIVAVAALALVMLGASFTLRVEALRGGTIAIRRLESQTVAPARTGGRRTAYRACAISMVGKTETARQHA